MVSAEMERIVAERGVLTDEAVVAEASPVDSPLHPFFDWDNATAGHKFRLGQARTLVRICREVIGEDEDGGPIYVRAYVSAKQAGREEPGYLATKEVLRSEISEQILLRSLKREIAGLRNKYSHLQQFGAVVRGELGELTG